MYEFKYYFSSTEERFRQVHRKTNLQTPADSAIPHFIYRHYFLRQLSNWRDEANLQDQGQA
jgi:hypothetical protein